MDLDLPQVPGIKTIVLMDMATGSVISLVPGQKVYMVTNIREAPAGTTETEQPKLSATGKKETVAGVSCEHHVMALGDGELDYCAAKGMGYGAGGSGAPALPSWDEWRKRHPEGFFVLKIEQVLGGKRDVMIEAKQIERKKLPDSLFVPPPGYTEMKPGRDGRQ